MWTACELRGREEREEGGKKEGREGERKKEVGWEEGREEAMEQREGEEGKEKGRNPGEDQSLWKEQWANKTGEIIIKHKICLLESIKSAVHASARK